MRRVDDAEQREPWYLRPWVVWTVAGIGLAGVALACFGSLMRAVLGGAT